MTNAISRIPEKSRFIRLFWDLGLVIIFLAAAFFRVTGLFWGEYTYPHPDERFLVWVGNDITPMECEIPGTDPNFCPEDQLRWMTVSEYFDTANSKLNPQNRDKGFYVYGTLPMFLTRFVVQWVFGGTGWEEMTQAGRTLSSLADLFTVLLVYMIGTRVFDRRVGVLGAAFMAAAVLHIQQSHFFTMDTFITFFTILAFYFAVMVSLDKREWSSLRQFWKHPLFILSLLFGISLGMAVASKLNAFLMAAMLPVGMLVRLVNFPQEQRLNRFFQAVVFLVMAAVVSLLTFRIFQPYAFTGPSFFDFSINPAWWQNIQSLLAQMSPDTDFPPAWQWARRSVLFSGQNLVIWGLGLPLGILAFSGFFWSGWRILTSIGRDQRWQKHIMLWVWTAVYFGYQSLAPNPTMRYQMPVYPTLVIFAAWAIIELWERGKNWSSGKKWLPAKSWQWVSILIAAAVLLTTFGWAFAFTSQYRTSMTRVAASRWIYNNIPGPITLPIQLNPESLDPDADTPEISDQNIYNQPIPLPNGFTLRSNSPYTISFQPKQSGRLDQVFFAHILDTSDSGGKRVLSVRVGEAPNGQDTLASGSVEADFSLSNHLRGESHTITLDSPVDLEENQTYYLTLDLPAEASIPAFTTDLALTLKSIDDDSSQVVLDGIAINQDYASESLFNAPVNGEITGIELSGIEGISTGDLPALSLSFLPIMQEQEQLASDFKPAGTSPKGEGRFELESAIPIVSGAIYQLRLSVPGFNNQLAFSGDAVANEGHWDEAVPFRIDGYDAYGGIYPPDMELQIFWEDTPEKLDHMVNVLDSSDFIAISSNRRWGTQPRMPERWPMTTLFFRSLLGCPPDQELLWCYRVAQTGQFAGEMGFDLVQVFQSDPEIGPIRINDQFAEEAFTVYDHPKVLIFEKNEQYSSERTRQILASANLEQIIHKPPLQYESFPANLLLPFERYFKQRMGGTWSELFDTQALINRYQPLTVLVWYLAIFLIGLAAYPLMRAIFPGLNDRGYPLARIAGLLIFSYLVWIAGSLQIAFTPTTITLIFILFASLGVILAVKQRAELKAEWQQKKRYFLTIEAIFLAFFLLDLIIRLGNPDIWHPYKGGERPMDFAYFNAVLKSTSFPPFDPWYAGGYLNYYYYGFVLFGVVVKWLGIVPAVAHNLLLPTILALLAVGAFSLAWNLFSGAANIKPKLAELSNSLTLKNLQYLSGISGAVGVALIGNLGTVRMIWQGFQRLAAPGGTIEDGSLVTKLIWGMRGLGMAITGDSLPYPIGDWYWVPSRTIPPMGDVEPITEFPFFTVLFSDTHAHLFALPLTLLALAFAISLVLSKGRWSSILNGIAGFAFGALVIGSLRPTNTWDYPTYLTLGMVAVGYTIFTYYKPSELWLETFPGLNSISLTAQRAILALFAMAALVGLSLLFYLPYSQWYALGYSEIRLWGGPRSPLSSYLTHWGVFLFVIITWMVVQARDWLAATPVSALRKIQKHAGALSVTAGSILLVTLFLAIKIPGIEQLTIEASPFGNGVVISLLVLPLAVLAGILLLRPQQPDAFRIVLFLVGTGLVLTLMVEIIVLVGDIGRMNTVFKFYLQVWILFAISAATVMGWLVAGLQSWQLNWRKAWQVGLAVLVFGAALFPIMGGMAKIRDRMGGDEPITLDGMKYMETASYDWKGPMDLGQDYRAIRWLQENVGVINEEGSPVIVEANLRDLYRWGSRYSIYTGLPSVVGWEWHQQQQRAINPGTWVSKRIDEVDSFYKTLDIESALKFLEKYDVRFIIVGQLERNVYPALGLDKFESYEGLYWDEVYRDQDTFIYQVIPGTTAIGNVP